MIRFIPILFLLSCAVTKPLQPTMNASGTIHLTNNDCGYFIDLQYEDMNLFVFDPEIDEVLMKEGLRLSINFNWDDETKSSCVIDRGIHIIEYSLLP